VRLSMNRIGENYDREEETCYLGGDREFVME